MPRISVVLCFIVAILLRIAPIPSVLFPFNPDWILLTVIACTLNTPERFSIGSAWVVGLLTDVLTSKLLGQYALAYAVCAYMIAILHRQMRHYPLIQQCCLVFLLLSISKAVIYITTSIQGIPRTDWTYWSPPIIGAIMWPFIYRIVKKFN